MIIYFLRLELKKQDKQDLSCFFIILLHDYYLDLNHHKKIKTTFLGSANRRSRQSLLYARRSQAI